MKRMEILNAIPETRAFNVVPFHKIGFQYIQVNVLTASFQVASHAGDFRGARISSLPTNACSTEDNIPFPLLYSRGK